MLPSAEHAAKWLPSDLEKMSEQMMDLEYDRVYIDDLLFISSSTFDDHLEKLNAILHRLEEAGLRVNATKSFFARTELEYLGYWITRNGIQPMPNKVQAIQRLVEPKKQQDRTKQFYRPC